MFTRFVEATQSLDGGFNHGKFMVALFDQTEWDRPTTLDDPLARRDPHEPMNPWPRDLYMSSPPRRLLRRCGWDQEHVFVMDLQTGEGAMFRLGGMPSADLEKHRVWVCPLFEPFLGWLYGWRSRATAETIPFGSAPTWFRTLPELVELPGVPGEMAGYRRKGPEALVFRTEREQSMVRVALRRLGRTLGSDAQEIVEGLLSQMQE